MLVRSGDLTRTFVVTVTTAAGTAMGMTHHCLLNMNSVFCNNFYGGVFSELFHKKTWLSYCFVKKRHDQQVQDCNWWISKFCFTWAVFITEQFCFTCYVGGLITCTFTYPKISVAWMVLVYWSIISFECIKAANTSSLDMLYYNTSPKINLEIII